MKSIDQYMKERAELLSEINSGSAEVTGGGPDGCCGMSCINDRDCHESKCYQAGGWNPCPVCDATLLTCVPG